MLFFFIYVFRHIGPHCAINYLRGGFQTSAPDMYISWPNVVPQCRVLRNNCVLDKPASGDANMHAYMNMLVHGELRIQLCLLQRRSACARPS